MANIKIGYVRPRWRGLYTAIGMYRAWDTVYYNGETYMVKSNITDEFSGIDPTDTTYWDQTSWFSEKARQFTSDLNQLRSDLNSAVGALTEDSEVILARGKYQTLAQRLDSMEKYAYLFSQYDGKQYGVSFKATSVSGDPVGTRLGDAVGLVAEISTATTKGTNDFDNIPAFRNIMSNGYLDDNGEFVITAIEGEPAFSRTGENGDVYSLFKLSYFKFVFTGTTDELWITDTYVPNEGWCPHGAFIRADGSLRPFVAIAAYEAGLNTDGVLSSISGVSVHNNVSHNNQITMMANKGTQYCGMTSKDVALLQNLFLVEYATKNSQNIMKGCTEYNYQYAVSVVEENTTRIIVTTAQAANFIVGSVVSVGNPSFDTSSGGLNIDRGQSVMHTKANRVKILSIEDLGNGNSAINLDTSVPFTTDTIQVSGVYNGETVVLDSPTYISTMNWETGTTDLVLGQTGQVVNNGKYTMKYRGVENLYGNYFTVLSDCVINNYKAYVCNDLTKFTSAAPTSDYFELAYDLSRTEGYIKELGFDSNHKEVLRFPTLTGGSSSTYYSDYLYINENTNEVLFGGFLRRGAAAGLFLFRLHDSLGHGWWCYAARLSTTGVCGAATYGGESA